MKFKSIFLKEGLFYKTIKFSDSVNLIFSKNNSVGKTSLLRIMLYAIGFPVPNTKLMNFSKCEIRVILTRNDEDIIIYRHNSYLELISSEGKKIFSLPYEAPELHEIIFDTNNRQLLQNILGVFYFDQEKGWTLLNRGKAVGNIGFSIEKLLTSLSDESITHLYEEQEKNNRYLAKYSKIQNFKAYQEEINILKKNITYDSYDEELKNKIAILQFELASLQKEMARVSGILQTNNSFKKYVEAMKLTVVSPSNEEILVTYDNILGFNDSVEYLSTKKTMLASKISSTKQEIDKLLAKLRDSDVDDMIDDFEKKLSTLNIDYVALEATIGKLKDSNLQIKQEIHTRLKLNNPIVDELYSIIMRYARELEILTYINTHKNFVFTNDLKSLSGAILHKMVFIFKLAYIKIVKSKTNISLPILLDSPNGREVTEENIKMMIDILVRDFPDNQIIISSIYKNEIPNMTVHELFERLIDNPTSDLG